jgi:uncharacterized alkaline shock family protein YloU
MYDQSQDSGKTTIAADVLIDITRLAALSVDGVNRLAPVPGGVDRLFRRGISEGVQIFLSGNTVNADLYVILDPNENIRDICREVQAQVARAISEMVGMDIGKINIHVEDFASYPHPAA